MIVETQDLRPVAGPTVPGWRRPLMVAVAALTLGIGGVLGAYLVSGRGAGAGLGPLARFAPADAAMYTEIDLTLPGAQRANLAALLDHWSAVNPDLLLGDEFAATVDDLAGDGHVPFTYTDDLAPWLSGEFASVLRSWPATPSDPMAMALPEATVIIGSRDRAAAVAFTDQLRELAAGDGMTFASTEHGGVTIWSMHADGGEMIGNAELAYAVSDGAVLVGTGADEVARTLDTPASGATVASDPEIGRLVAALPAERVGLAVVDTRASVDQLLADLGTAQPSLAASLEAYAAGIAPHSVVSLSFEADRAVTTAVAAQASGAFATRPLSVAMAERIPADALFYAAMPGIGPSVDAGLDVFLATMATDPFSGPMMEDMIAGFESTTGVALEDLLDWADDAAVYAAWDGSQPSGGIIFLTDDPAAATAQIDALVDALEREAGSDVTVERDAIDGAAVTRLLGGAGTPPVEIAIGADSVTVTVGEGGASALASLDPSGSLASVDRFSTAIGSVGGSATSTAAWIDLAGIVDAVAMAMPEQASMMTMVLANLEPLDFVAAATREEGGLVISRLDLVVR